MCNEYNSQEMSIDQFMRGRGEMGGGSIINRKIMSGQEVKAALKAST